LILKFYLQNQLVLFIPLYNPYLRFQNYIILEGAEKDQKPKILGNQNEYRGNAGQKNEISDSF